jgi:hypothetical protein
MIDMFKLWFGSSKQDIINRVEHIPDIDLRMLAKCDWYNSGGAQKVQGDAIKKAMKKRGLDIQVRKGTLMNIYDMSMEELQDLVSKIEQEIVSRGIKKLHTETEKYRIKDIVYKAIKKFNSECTLFKVEPTDDDHMHWVEIEFKDNGNLIGPGSLQNFSRQFTELSKALDEALIYHKKND